MAKRVDIQGSRFEWIEKLDVSSGVENAPRMFTELSVAAGIVSLCVLLHVFGILLMARALFTFQDRLLKTQRGIRYFVLLIVLFAINMLLHVTAAIIWAVFYYSRALFSDFETSLYFSLASYTTIGYGDVVLTPSWRLLGAIEGISGVLLCGISTAFMFAVLNAMFRIWMENKQPGVASRVGNL